MIIFCNFKAIQNSIIVYQRIQDNQTWLVADLLLLHFLLLNLYVLAVDPDSTAALTGQIIRNVAIPKNQRLKFFSLLISELLIKKFNRGVSNQAILEATKNSAAPMVIERKDF
jgi:hypothetical protein